MTTEELKKEAEEYSHKACAWLEDREPLNERDITNAYLASAEPREKRIAELETRCNELFLQTCEQAEKIKKLKSEIENDRDLPAIAYMQGAEKQKKKDEEELQKWKDEWQEQVQKATDEGYARTLQTIQLTKAKDILQRLMENQPTPSSMYEEIDLVGWREVNKEAEQFLSEVEK